MTTRLVFMGSPEFAIPTLQAVVKNYQVVGVVTQPDRPAGRGHKLTPPPVKSLAIDLGLDIIQPNKLRDAGVIDQLVKWEPDLIIVCAFGQILRSDVLALPKFGCINVHASLLPRWRGASPIQAAILHGDDITGVTIMQMDPGLDTGPILSQRTIPITNQITAGELGSQLAEIGADLLIETLPGFLSGEIKPEPQDSAKATRAPLLIKDDGALNFSQSAEELARQVRAFNPWPGAFTHWNNRILKIHIAHSLEDYSCSEGLTCVVKYQPALGTAHGILVLDQVQPEGKKPMPGQIFLQGARGWGFSPSD